MTKSQLEFPQFKKKVVITTQVDQELIKLVRIEAKKRKLKLREVIEYGMRVFISESDTILKEK